MESKLSQLDLQITACKVRMGIIEGTYNAKSGHPGGSLSVADTITYLYSSHMRIFPDNPNEPTRDRMVLSKGHTAPALYSMLAQKGFFPPEEMKELRKIGSRLQGHPVMGTTPGVDFSTGSLGQGISAACGMALAGKLDKSDYRVFAILGDGEIQEGQVWEAAMFASHYKLDNLIAVVDNNNLQIDGRVDDVMSPYPIDEKFKAFGWNVICIDAHDFSQIENAFKQADEFLDSKSGKPTVIIQKSIKGKGVSFMENKGSWHGVAPNQEQYELAMSELKKHCQELESKKSGGAK
ncbi:MAG: transketolase [Oscillospiraceae bacterium]|nr:transketolase [Oscillospiraceae bacterium]